MSKVTEEVENKNENLSSSNIFDRMKMFDQSHQIGKKNSIFQGNQKGKEEKKIFTHDSLINSVHFNNNSLITSDISGFVKSWKL